jgi:hypothetical protein
MAARACGKLVPSNYGETSRRGHFEDMNPACQFEAPLWSPIDEAARRGHVAILERLKLPNRKVQAGA